MFNAQWLTDIKSCFATNSTSFVFNIPSKLPHGFAEDYKCIILNVKHELF